ncbi:MAG: copper amine oxidase N-terminal domain-containing protein [Defluviitaleaceae bacterium]|nr:copper amine oxidase N-terminal domain-containing protein [Defluviitaleaceae bacterium]
MNIIKKCTALLLIFLIALQTVLPAFANYFEEDGGILIAQDDEPSLGLQSAAATVTGLVKDITANENVYNVLISVIDDNNNDVILKVFEDTAIIDNLSKQRLSLADINEGDMLVAYVSNAMTMSIPPQINAHAIIANIRRNAPVARYMTIAEVQTSDEGSKQVLSENSAYLITISDQTNILPYKTGQTVGLENVLVGKRMFAWFDVMSLSHPAQAKADYVVILPSVEETGTISRPITEFTTELKQNGHLLSPENYSRLGIRGNIVKLYKTPLFAKNKEIMAPVRILSNELGFEVEWNAAEKSVLIHTDYDTFRMAIGYDGYTRESDQSVAKLGIAPMLVGGITYVPVVLFDFIFENNETTNVVEGMLVIS